MASHIVALAWPQLSTWEKQECFRLLSPIIPPGQARGGRYDLTPDEVANSFVFRGEGQCHLVLARFHKPKTFPMNQELMDQLFVDLMARAGK